jgi:hypothetical protein
MAHRRGLDRLVHHTGAENGQISMKITSFHSNREGGASKPGIMVLTLRHHQRGYAEIAATLRCSECEARAIVYEVLRSLRVHVADRL